MIRLHQRCAPHVIGDVRVNTREREQHSHNLGAAAHASHMKRRASKKRLQVHIDAWLLEQKTNYPNMIPLDGCLKWNRLEVAVWSICTRWALEIATLPDPVHVLTPPQGGLGTLEDLSPVEVSVFTKTVEIHPSSSVVQGQLIELLLKIISYQRRK